MNDAPVQCCRCRNKHMQSQRVSKPTSRKALRGGSIQFSDLCCPRCGCRSFYDLTPQVAWCWATGLIEIGDVAPDGAIEIAGGPKASLTSVLSARARHGQGESSGKLLVPGVPEAEGQQAKGDALAAWLRWCGARRNPQGVHFAVERTAS